MRLVPTRRLELGAVLARDVTAGVNHDRALLRAGVRISERYRQALLDGGFNAVYIEDEVSAGIEVTPALSEKTRAIATNGLRNAFASVPAAVAARERMPQEAIDQLSTVAGLIAHEIAESGDFAMALNDLGAADQYTLQHSIDVCVVGLTVAKRLFDEQGRIDYRGRRVWDRLEQWLAKLGVGLMLHDVGKVGVPAAILNKAGRLEPDELEQVRQHPLIGLELLSSDLISPLVKAVVRSHHERWDGGGYPHGIAGDLIPHFARITAIADVFDAVTSERPYHAAAPQHVGHRVINEGAGSQFDADIVKVFNKVVAPYPPGDEIVLADGRRGIVVSCPAKALDRPLVRIAWDSDGERVDLEEVDLAERPELYPGAQPVPA
jgi:HD-GYP domain-containing protein (c-di-GMP phosphodiesterase class II)